MIDMRSAKLASAALALFALSPPPTMASPPAAAPPAPAPRCGWIVNPSPANWWLTDRDGEWLIAAQGGYQAPGLDNVPDLSEHNWVVTNGSSYGYGCGCVSGRFDTRKKRVTRISAVRQKPIATCKADHRLKRPG
jgi:hypothetical protein